MSDWVHDLARVYAVELLHEFEEREEGLPIPLIWMEDPLIHTDTAPFCSDETCPCHYDSVRFGERVYKPFMDGLLTFSEANALRWGDNI